MPYLVDGSNLGGVFGGAGGARDAGHVVRRLLAWRRRGRVIAIFDGEPDPRLAHRYGSLELVWSGSGRSADDEIVRRLTRDRERWTVVTDDRDLARRCRERGARVLAGRDLAARLAEASRRQGEPATDDKPEASAADRAHWEKIFGDEE